MKRKAKLKLFVFDMDGTALGGHKPYEQFPKPFVRFLAELKRLGIGWATNTTWGPEGQLPVMKRSKVTTRPVFLSGGMSRYLATVRNGRVVDDKRYTGKIARLDKRFTARNLPLISKLFTKLLREGLVHRLAFNYWNQNMLFMSCKKKDARRVWGILSPLLESGEFFSFDLRTDTPSASLMPRHMNKGAVMREYQKRLKIGPESIIVAGDGMNDWQMFEPELARWMVCPANANPKIREKVRSHGGVVGRKKYSWGVIEATRKILAMHDAD